MKTELKYIEELDYILHFLATNPNALGSIKDYELFKHLDASKNITMGRLLKILNKLSKDNFVDVEEKEAKYSGGFHVDGGATYKITFDGLVYDELGGYKGKYLKENESKNIQVRENKRITRIQNQQLWLTFILALGALVASIYYGIEIWKYFTQCN